MKDTEYLAAKTLAESLWRDHFAHEAPQWKVEDSTMGVILQISNMTAGIVDKMFHALDQMGISDGKRIAMHQRAKTSEQVLKWIYNDGRGREVFPADSMTSDEPSDEWLMLASFFDNDKYPETTP